MADDDYPTPEQWAEWRKNGSVCGTCKVRVWPAPAVSSPNAGAEQKARDMLERMEVPDAQRMTSGDLVELANLIRDCEKAGMPRVTDSDRDRLLAIVDDMEDRGVDFAWITAIREIALGGQTFESWQESRRPTS